MNFIKKIFKNTIDDEVHIQFSRYGQGTFETKALIEIINTTKAIKVKTSSEFTNELVRLVANTIKDKVHVTGIIFATRDLTKETGIQFQEIKNAMGIKKHIVNQELSKEQVFSICEKCPRASINLSFATEYGALKVKEKPPKSGKPGKDDEAPKIDYCVLTTTDSSILEDFAFDVKEKFKKAFFIHTYIIDELIVPKEYENDFTQARFHAKRKGKLIRRIDVDGKKSEKEINFIA